MIGEWKAFCVTFCIRTVWGETVGFFPSRAFLRGYGSLVVFKVLNASVSSTYEYVVQQFQCNGGLKFSCDSEWYCDLNCLFSGQHQGRSVKICLLVHHFQFITSRKRWRCRACMKPGNIDLDNGWHVLDLFPQGIVVAVHRGAAA